MKAIWTFVLPLSLLSCFTTRENIVFEAFEEPFLDWYSLTLYSNRTFDLNIPSIDYTGTYQVSADTIYLQSKETVQRIGKIGNNREEIIKDRCWIFLIDSTTNRIRTVEKPNSPTISIRIVENKL
jgi:hypothetical protein